jgi:hypothetical protein
MFDMLTKPKFLATGIGSMPFKDARQAVEVSLRSFSEAPVWPQLPRLGLNEQMNVQYTDGLPGIVIDRQEKRIYFETSEDYSEPFAQFYGAYLTATDPDSGDGDCSAMAISPEFSKGIYAMEERMQAEGKGWPFVKVQTTGPCTFTLGVVDEKRQAIYYNKDFRDMAVKGLAMKCR